MVLFALVTSETTTGVKQRKEMLYSAFAQGKSLYAAKRFQLFNTPVNPKTRSLELDQDRPLSSSGSVARGMISSRQPMCVYLRRNSSVMIGRYPTGNDSIGTQDTMNLRAIDNIFSINTSAKCGSGSRTTPDFRIRRANFMLIPRSPLH
jgi:hypothetical protein